MQEVNKSLLLLAGLFVAGCHREVRIVYARTAPDGTRTVSAVLYQPYAYADQRLKIVLQTRTSSPTILFQDDGMDVDPCFAEVAWRQDSQAVAALVRNCYGALIIVGYDLAANAALSPESAKDLLRTELAVRYGFKPGWIGDPYPPRRRFVSDPIDWAASEEARMSFSNRQRQRR